MRVLVIGRSGQLASSFKKVDFLGRLHFIGKDDYDSGDRASVHRLLSRFNPELIVNCAAYTLVDKAETDRDACKRLNVDFVSYLTEWCGQNSTKLIHFSTDYVFDGTKPSPYLEADIVHPVNLYGESKARGEKVILDSSAEAVIFRISWVYSEFGTNFLKTMIRLGQERESLSIVADQIGSPCYAVNVAEVIYEWIFERDLSGFVKGIYHLVPHETLSWFDFAKAIFKNYGDGKPALKVTVLKNIKTADYVTAARRPLNSVMNSDKAFSQLGLRLEPFSISILRALKNSG